MDGLHILVIVNVIMYSEGILKFLILILFVNMYLCKY